jgi:hypothetical protein
MLIDVPLKRPYRVSRSHVTSQSFFLMETDTCNNTVGKIFSGYQLCRLVKYYRRFRDQLCPHHQSLIVGREMVPETCLISNQLTWLIAREDYITLNRRESFRSYIKITVISEIMSFRNFLGSNSSAILCII